MPTRRRFTRLAVGSVLGGSAFLALSSCWPRRVWAATRKMLAPGTDRKSLIHEDPAALDPANLEITPLEKFETMGPTDRAVDLAQWRLEVTGRVGQPVSFTYAQLTALPPIERNVLLICPGVFANHGRWKGFSVQQILQQANFDRAASRVVFEDTGGKSAGYPIADVLSGKVFLAYQVNGAPLPRKHGFPLRVVAEDYYGAEWVKYVSRVRVENS
jgi:DMSO/TMAO reductase YedYZ molybdopterin-dependent catalytic subunit